MALSQVPPELLDQLPAEASPVDAVPDGRGGYWVLGSDGGVFAVGGASYFGSYPWLPEEGRQGERSFTHIYSPAPGQYTLISNMGELYEFGQGKFGFEGTYDTGGGGQGPAEGVETDKEKAERESAQIWLKGQLELVGLGELATTGFGGKGALTRFEELGGTQGAAEAVLIEMRAEPIYQAKFPGMAVRERNKLAPMTEAQYLEWRSRYTKAMQGAGMPAGFYDSEDDFADLIGKDVSPEEMQSRMDQGYKAALQSDPQVRSELYRLFGVTDGMLAAFFADPDKATPLIMDAFQQAQISGAAQIAGFGGLTVAEAQRLQGKGMGFGEAQAAFGLLGQQQELMGRLDIGEEAIGRETQLEAAGGDVGSQQAIQRKAVKRKAAFEGGGGFAGGQGGISGLGEAS